MTAIPVAPALAALLPARSVVHWTGTDDTTPAGFFGVIGTDGLGNITFWLLEGTPEVPTAMVGRVVSDPRGPEHPSTVYGGRNRYLGTSRGNGPDSDRLVRDHAAAAGRAARDRS